MNQLESSFGENSLKYKQFIADRRANRALLETRLTKLEDKLKLSTDLAANLVKAHDILTRTAILSQQNLKTAVEELVTKALQAAFGESYSFEIESKIMRNKPEMNFIVIESGMRRILKDGFGGGVADIVAFSLRIVLWALCSKRSQPVIVLDEPLKFVDKTTLTTFGTMLRQLSEMLNIQFIIVTHESPLLSAATKKFSVQKINGISKVKELNDESEDLLSLQTDN